MRNALSAERAYDKAVAEALAKGLPPPRARLRAGERARPRPLTAVGDDGHAERSHRRVGAAARVHGARLCRRRVVRRRHSAALHRLGRISRHPRRRAPDRRRLGAARRRRRLRVAAADPGRSARRRVGARARRHRCWPSPPGWCRGCSRSCPSGGSSRSSWRRASLWQNANANMSGVVLVPLAGALAPPFIELAALAAAVGPRSRWPSCSSRRARGLRTCISRPCWCSRRSWRGACAGTAARMTTEALDPGSRARSHGRRSTRRFAECGSLCGGRHANGHDACAGWLGYALWIPPVVLAARR